MSHDHEAEQPNPHPPSAGPGYRTVGGYYLLRPIGQGAMSQVYVGYDPVRLQQVAVKLLPAHLAADRNSVIRFSREARMSRLLSHPHIIRGLAHGFDPSLAQHYLILEFVEGPNALDLLHQRGPLPVGVVVRIGNEIASALQYMHSLGYVHRDVKPDNILLGPGGFAKLGDLGLAKRLEGDVELTSTTQGVGTPHYMPYEQAVNGDLVDGRSDVFALGATLYHLLTGRLPFPGETHEELLRVKARDTIPAVRAQCPDVPAELERILVRTLALDPRDRFQTAADLAVALASTGLATTTPLPPEWLSGGTGASAAANQTRADLPLDPSSELPAPPPNRRHQRRYRSSAILRTVAASHRRRTRLRRWSVAGMSLLILVALLGALWFESRTPSRSAPALRYAQTTAPTVTTPPCESD